jgi:hypothetical protein
MNLYRQSIAIFGFVLPVLIAVIVIAIGVFVKGKITSSFDEKLTHYKDFKRNKIMALKTEAEISDNREHVVHWEELIGTETASTVSNHLRTIEDKLPSKEFQTTGQQYPTAKGGFASVAGQDSAQVRLTFRATFRSMQQALLELETRMPQLQLQELRINPSTNSNSLNFDLSYTAWEK